MFTDDRLELLQNLYVANVKNRLRELESPTEELQKRWIWELIQNAKDCSKELSGFKLIPDQDLSNQNNKQVDIKIIYDKSQRLVIFKHNGFPFIRNTLDSLMYKNSTKDSDEDNTGRFGTGFMTSHTLSRVVKIQAPFYHQSGSSFTLRYIEATIFREGKTDRQLRQEFQKMEKSKKIFVFNKNDPNHNWTTFTYQITNDSGIRSAELGIQSFRENINKIFLFCNEIRSIQINNEKPLIFSQIELKKYIIRTDSESFNLEEKTINQQKFIVATINEANTQYSQKMSIEHEKNFDDKKIQCSIAFEIDSNKQIIDQKSNSICLFCTFPLVGSEGFQLPFLLNSPQFETLTERDGIFLEGNLYDSNKILTNTGLNYIIIDRSISLFSSVLNYLNNNQYSHFSTFSNGLTNSISSIPKLKSFYDKLRSIMENKCRIFNTTNKYMLLKNALFLDFSNIISQISFHSIVSQIYSNVASFDECIHWNGKLWNGLSVIDVDNFLNHIMCIVLGQSFSPSRSLRLQLSNQLFINHLNITTNDINFLNTLYIFLIKNVKTKSSLFENRSKIYNYKIILNSNNKFSYLDELKSDLDCSHDFNQIMSLCDSWKKRIIHPKIYALNSILQKATTNDAVNELSRFFNKHQDDINKLLSFTQFVLKENKFRIKMYKIAKFFYGFSLGQEIYVTNVDPVIWTYSDKYLIIQIKNLIMKKKNCLINETDLEYYNIFYEIYQKNFPYNDEYLVPNINLKLIEKDKLIFLSKEIPQVLIDLFKQFYDFSYIAHPEITSVSFNKIYTLNTFAQLANSKSFLYNNNNKLIYSRVFSILSFLPSKDNQRLYNYQVGILTLAQIFLQSEIKSIETTITDELFWKSVNEVVLSFVDSTIKKSKNLENLKNNLTKDENDIINYLNIYYKLLSTSTPDKLKDVMVPTLKGDFRPASEVSLSKGISNELFDLFNLIKDDFDIRDKLVHPKIEYIFLNVIDIHEFLSSLCNSLKDDQLIHDSKIIDAISNLKLFNSNNSSSENDPLLEKLYVANIKNRLNEIQNPNENDKARWPWELIQNAKDTIYSPSNTIGQKKVKIFIDVNNNEVIFSHNGLPFTENSYFGLLYKISQDKNVSQTTGRFGTGFVSTHVLSKIVQITGNKINKNGEKQGFSVTIHRKGLNEADIIKDFRTMQKSLQIQSNTYYLTSFKYKIENEQCQECVKLGLDNFKRNISAVLINCNEIRFVNLNENGMKFHFYSTSQFIKKIGNIQFYIYRIYKNKRPFEKYIVLLDEINQLNISIQINERWEIICHNGSESLFSIFPLIGSNSHILPFLINSPKFETVTERNALFLNGPSEINSQITNTGKNRSLLIESTNLYNHLIKYLIENKCPNLFELARGLSLTTKPYNSFDLDWYESNFLLKMRKILASIVSVHSNYGKFVLLENATFSSKEINIEDLQQFIKLAQKYYLNIVCKKDTLAWRDKIWNQINVVTIKDLIDKVINDKSFVSKDRILYLNDLLGFIWKYDKNLLYDNKIIPDMNNEFHCLFREREKNDFKESKTVNDVLIIIMESIQIQWKSTHMNNLINSIKLSEDKVIDAETRIIEQIRQNNSLSFELIAFVLENNEFRNSMYDFSYELKLTTSPKIIVKDINKKIWEEADSYALTKIIEKISLFGQNKVKESINFISKFVQFLKKFYNETDLFKESKVFPSEKYSLKKLNELKNKSQYFHDHLNPIMIKFFNKDFDNDILHSKINQIVESKKNEYIYDYLNIINHEIKNLGLNDQIVVAESIISLIPSNEKVTTQNKIFFIYKKLINQNLNEISIPPNFYSKEKWRDCNQIIIKCVCSQIEQVETLQIFQKKFNLENCFDILNSVYLLSSEYEMNFKIIPNKNGIFMNKNNLFEDPKIGDDLFECLSILEPQINYKDKIADSRVQNINLQKFDISEFYKQLYHIFIKAIKNADKNDKVIELIQKITNIDDPSFFDKITSKSMTNDQKVRNDILQDAHVSFIKNRLRELNSPKDKDFQRWPFELIQNANDSILVSKSDLSNRKVKIEFDFLDEKVIFRHNGSPFKYKSLMALLYQYSKGKSSSNLTTGRFGTGFMSTFILSRIVHIQGDVETEKISGFDVMIYRDGNKKKELKIGVENMEKSLKINLPIKGITTFEYDFKNNSQYHENSFKAYKQGFLSLLTNLSQVLILNPTIESVAIKHNNEYFIYKANHEEGPIQTVTINKNNKIKIDKFILFNSIEKFQSIDISVDCLLQIGLNNKIINSHNKNVLFISYPLIGVYNFSSPFIINSLDFEPEKERDEIIIQTDTDCESNESLINKFIITKSVKIFKEMVNFILKSNFTDLFNLCIGLNHDSKNLFYQQNFIKEMRKIILNSAVFETQFGLKNYKEIIIPNIENEELFKNNKNLYKDFYNLVSQISIESKFVMSLEISSKWLSLLWSDFESKFDIIDLFKYISNKDSISQLTLIQNNFDSKIMFINNLIEFITRMEDYDDVFNKYNLLINIKGKFVNKRKIHFFNVPLVFFDLLDIVEFDYEEQMLHKEIQKLYQDFKFDIFELNNAIEIIKDKINHDNALQLMQYILKNDNKREELFQYSKYILNSSMKEILIDNSTFDELIINKLKEMFDKIDNIIIYKIIDRIKYLDVKKNIEFLNRFVKFLKTKQSSDEFEKIIIFPNQEYSLCSSKSLFKDGFKDDNVKDIIKKIFSINLREKLILDSFSDITSFEVFNFYKISSEIIEYLEEKSFLQSKLFDEKLDLFSIIFQYSSFENDQKQILNLLHFFFGLQITPKKLNQEDLCLPNLTKLVINMAVDEIIQFLSKFSSVNEMILKSDFNDQILFENLNTLYTFSIEGKIFPNQFGELKCKDDIFIIDDNQVEKDSLIKLFEFLIEFQNSEELKHSIMNESIHIQDEKIKKFNLIDLNFLAINIMKIINKNKEENKDCSYLMEKLFEFLDTDPKMRAAFSPLIEEKLNRIPLLMLNDIDSYIEDESQEIGYRGEALIYEELLKSGNFSSVIWLANSKIPKTTSITLNNGNIYHIYEHSEPYDIFAEDFKGNKYFIEVKSKKSFDSKQKVGLGLSRNQVYFASNSFNQKENFVLAIVLNVMDENPIFLFLKKANDEFISAQE